MAVVSRQLRGTLTVRDDDRFVRELRIALSQDPEARLASDGDRVHPIPKHGAESAGLLPGRIRARQRSCSRKRAVPIGCSVGACSERSCQRGLSDPTSVVADRYDPVVNPGARSWFKSSARELLELARGYLDLLDRYGVRWVELRTMSAGRVVYEDEVQVVTVPFRYPDDWPFES